MYLKGLFVNLPAMILRITGYCQNRHLYAFASGRLCTGINWFVLGYLLSRKTIFNTGLIG